MLGCDKTSPVAFALGKASHSSIGAYASVGLGCRETLYVLIAGLLLLCLFLMFNKMGVVNAHYVGWNRGGAARCKLNKCNLSVSFVLLL